ncbi:TetR/AcrR family transcriptional regulator [Amycolatopsis anabasis]|uniref:TetR/AcrR family transcriptional regulator n=1 Tax=Amycolatopsis anabasis TaxID=1840409 RepID=UPI00131DD77A|nr:TetR/AcrR family transcriptional regulator [Amycolatopsis anabasis]
MSEKPEFDVLPRGRHRLSRESVRSSQRSRLLHGMADAVAEQGYVRTSVADVLKRARVSRETFYQHFADKEECFLALLDRVAGLLATQLMAEPEGAAEEPELDRLERVLTKYFATLTAEASMARVFFVESYVAGPAAQRKRFEVQDRFIDLLETGLATLPEWQRLPDSRFACRLLVGGISSLVASTLIGGEPERLPELGPQVMLLVRQLIG